MKIVVDYIPKCSSDCVFSRYLSCERRRCVLTDGICSLDNDIPNECHKLTTVESVQKEVFIKPVTEINLSAEELYKALTEHFRKRLEKGE